MPLHAISRAKGTRTSAGTTELIAAGGSGFEWRLKHVVVTILTFATDGKVFLLDGTTEIFGWDASTAAGGQPPDLKFDEGWPLTANKAIQLKTEGAIEVFAYVAAEKAQASIS